MARIKYYDSVAQEWKYADMAVAMPPSRLPSAYQEVEYIESTGTQYIDTGVNSYRTALGLDLQFTDSTFGSNGSADSGILQITGNSADNPYLGFRNEGNTWESTITCTDRNLVVFDAYKGTIYHNGSLIHTMTGASLNGSATLYLFARYSTQWGNAYCKEKLYGAKVFSYLGTTVDKCLVRHYIPCYRIADDEIGMYDIVNDVFYTNDGTGTFTKGADV